MQMWNNKKLYFQSQPYSMVKQSQERITGNEAFEGFAIDLIAEIAQILSKKEKLVCLFCVTFYLLQNLTLLWNGWMMVPMVLWTKRLGNGMVWWENCWPRKLTWLLLTLPSLMRGNKQSTFQCLSWILELVFFTRSLRRSPLIYSLFSPRCHLMFGSTLLQLTSECPFCSLYWPGPDQNCEIENYLMKTICQIQPVRVGQPSSLQWRGGGAC